MGQLRTYTFYKEFYNENRVALLQYESLRKNFNVMVDDVLGPDYYNEGMDVYECDRIICEDLMKRLRPKKNIFQRLFNKK